MASICVLDIGGTAIKYGRSRNGEAPEALGECPTPGSSLDDLLGTIARLADGCDGVAAALPGIVDSDRGLCLTGGALSYNAGVPLAREIEARTGVPATIENDARCAGIAELEFGALAGVENGLLATLGTGLGGALVADGKIVHGKHGYAGELSFPTYDPARWGSFPAKAGVLYSTRGMVARANELLDEPVADGRNLFARIESGDGHALEGLRLWCRDFDVMLFNLAVLLDLERVVIGGGVSRQPLLLETLRSEMERLYEELPAGVKNSPVTPPDLTTARFGADANLVGAWLRFKQAHDEIR
jgi:predicted NBD/HSP70 family sugar kinase